MKLEKLGHVEPLLSELAFNIMLVSQLCIKIIQEQKKSPSKVEASLWNLQASRVTRHVRQVFNILTRPHLPSLIADFLIDLSESLQWTCQILSVDSSIIIQNDFLDESARLFVCDIDLSSW
jgi:hypothetical protein